MIHVYAIVNELDDLPEMRGLGDATLERKRIDKLDVVLSRSEGQTIEPSNEAVVRHASVVEALRPRGQAVLPAQFGHVFLDDEQLVAAVRRRRAQLEDGLARVRGCVEFGLRILLREPESVGVRSSPSAREYMQRRLEQASRRKALAGAFHEPLARLARSSSGLHRGPRGDVFTAAYLVPEQEAEAFCLEVERLQSQHGDVDFVCSGPWPPYSFADDRETGG
jgi:Gas vesicle synthesis protein GvpL/GvpF